MPVPTRTLAWPTFPFRKLFRVIKRGAVQICFVFISNKALFYFCELFLCGFLLSSIYCIILYQTFLLNLCIFAKIIQFVSIISINSVSVYSFNLFGYLPSSLRPLRIYCGSCLVFVQLYPHNQIPWLS